MLHQLPLRCAAAAACALAGGITAQAPSLLSFLQTTDPQISQWTDHQLTQDSTLTDVQFVRINTREFNGVAGLPRGDSRAFSLVLFGKSHPIHLERQGQQLEYTTFRGRMSNTDATIVFAVGPQGDSAGTIEFGDEHYMLRYTGHDDVHALFRRDPEQVHGHARCGTDSTFSTFTERTAEDDLIDQQSQSTLDGGTQPIIDVCAFWTPGGQSAAGGSIASTVANAVALANTGSFDSGVNHTLRMVYGGLTNYAETGTSTDLSRFRSSTDGFMDEVHGIRDDYGGDLMVLIIGSSSSFCGVGYLMGSNSVSQRSNAFSVTVFGCLSGNTLAHEMGHTMGCAHDRQNAGGALFSYSYGYRTPNNAWRTIMSYSPGTRVNVWSGPNVMHNGNAMGTATEDNARSLNNAASTISNFKTQTSYYWENVGGGITRPGGQPKLSGTGTVNGLEPVELTISSTLPNAPGALLIGNTTLMAPVLGGILVPNVLASVPVTGSFFDQTIPIQGMTATTPPLQLYWQLWFVDSGAVQGFSASDGICVNAL